MNLKRTVLLVVLCTAAFPVMSSARSQNDNHAVYSTAKREGVSSFFVRVLTLGHKSHPQG